ncbi:hypothetical protein HYPSUDRAFT_470172 [Hypholoma sublateritium FD-334 SS-4]|uniref:Uncharacterized protein n=1 Tax=Hypholoma sublateritium (strain FD-334 SS-4) TaxID=945553 RepID=A0A0D2LSU8_HYPSF|nr:hypothetical protein HYPSUDRAFT_470172 [Hypholoma sublateritium FD-334 SS-4]
MSHSSSSARAALLHRWTERQTQRQSYNGDCPGRCLPLYVCLPFLPLPVLTVFILSDPHTRLPSLVPSVSMSNPAPSPSAISTAKPRCPSSVRTSKQHGRALRSRGTLTTRSRLR